MPECGCVHIKSNCQVIRFLLIKDLKQDIQKSENRSGVQSCRVGQIRHPVKCSVQNTVPVYEHKFFTLHPLFPLALPAKLY